MENQINPLFANIMGSVAPAMMMKSPENDEVKADRAYILKSKRIYAKLEQIENSELSDSAKCDWYHTLIENMIDRAETHTELNRFEKYFDEKIEQMRDSE